MKFFKAIAVLFFNVVAVQSFSFPYQSFEDVLSDEMIIHELTHKHPEPFKKPEEPSRISKILRFQMKKILHEQNKHFNHGNANRSNRAEFLGDLVTRFKNLAKKSNEKISRRGFQIPRTRFLKSRRF